MTEAGQRQQGKALSARGEQARARLKAAAQVVLEEAGYHGMRITDVTRQAGVATGLFYHYFKDLRTLVTEVLEDFIATFEDTHRIEADVPRGDWFGRILAHHRVMVESYARHPGLMRCVFQLSDESELFRERWNRSNAWRLRQLVDLLPKIFPGSVLSEDEAELVVYALGQAGQRTLSSYYVERDPALQRLGFCEEAMAEWLSVLFYRGLFLENPPAQRLQHAGKVLALVRRTGHDQGEAS